MKQLVIIQKNDGESIFLTTNNLMFLTAAGGLIWIFVLHLLLKKREEKRTKENI